MLDERMVLVAVCLIGTAGLAGCIGDSDETDCEPGESVPCVCINGEDGTRVCRENGTGYRPCACGEEVEAVPLGDVGGADRVDGGFREEPQLQTRDVVQLPVVEVGDQTRETVELANAGGLPLVVQTIELEEGREDSQRELMLEGTLDPVEILPGEAVEFDVVYRPINSTADTGEITIQSGGQGTVDEQKTIEVRTAQLEPRIEVPARVSFSAVAPGTLASKRVDVVNVGEAPLEVDGVDLTGNSNFQVTKFIDQSGDSGPPQPDVDEPISSVEGTSIEPSGSVALRVYFEPEERNPETADLIIYSNDPNASQKTVRLEGNG